jgi:hypothetical protein
MDYAEKKSAESAQQPSNNFNDETSKVPEQPVEPGPKGTSLKCDLEFKRVMPLNSVNNSDTNRIICAEMSWVVGPAIPQNSQGAILILKFYEKASGVLLENPMSEYEPRLSFWSRMGHGNDFQDKVIVEVPDTERGLVVFKNIDLSCYGADWEVFVRIRELGSKTNEWLRAGFVWKQSEFLGE